jgi:hypothetical protein
MIKFLRNILGYLSKTKGIIILIILFLLVNFIMHKFLPVEFSKIDQSKPETAILDLKFSYSHDFVKTTLNSYGDQGRAKYLKFSLIDMLYPLIYSLLLASLLFKLFYNSRYNPYLFALFAGIFDYIENLFLIHFNLAFPDINNYEVIISSFATSLKWSFIIISFIALFFGVVKIIKNRN